MTVSQILPDGLLWQLSVGQQSGIHGILVWVRVRWAHSWAGHHSCLGPFYHASQHISPQNFCSSVVIVLTFEDISRFPLLDPCLQQGVGISCLSCISRPLFGLTVLHCLDLPLTFHLIFDPRWTPWTLWERRSVGWHAARTTPSTLMLPSLLVSLNATVCVNLAIYLSVL